MLIPGKIRLCYCFIASSIPLIVHGVNQPFVHRWNNNYRDNSHNNNSNNNKLSKNFDKLWDDMNLSGGENILADIKLPKTLPFSKDDLTKQDESNDSIFYDQPTFAQQFNGVNQPFVHRWNNYYRHNSHYDNNKNKKFKNFEKLWGDMFLSGRENVLKEIKLSKTFPFSK